MSGIAWLLERFAESPDDQALVWKDQAFSYGRLLDEVAQGRFFLHSQNVGPGSSFILDADFSPRAIALMLAGWEAGCTVVPLASHVTAIDRIEIAALCGASLHVVVHSDDELEALRREVRETPELLRKLHALGHPGLVLFTSGSSGHPKGVVHDAQSLLKKFETRRHRQRLLTFLLFDHIGGLNTLLYALSNGGCAITVPDREVRTVCRAIQDHKVEVIPASPTFLNLLLMSGVHSEYDLSSLRLINYATEVMPEPLLHRLSGAFPRVEFRQSYGLSEVGILRSRSRDNTSCWIKVGGEGFQTRIVDSMLQIKADSSMLGYINAPSPFTEDGWFETQDEVEVDGEWIRIKGRKSDLINVGGEKVYPGEVESIILELPNITDVLVGREPHPIIGNIVVATLRLVQPEPLPQLITRVRKHCFGRLPSFKVPVKIYVKDEIGFSGRFKKDRRDV